MIKDYFVLDSTLRKVIQHSGLNVGEIYFIVKSIYNELEQQVIQAIENETKLEQKNIDENVEEPEK